MDQQRRHLLRAGAALALVATLPLRAFGAPPADADAAFDTRDFDWTDVARRRAVPARLYLPRGEAAVPLVVFSHGIGGSRRGYAWLGQHFARHGIASLHPQHIGSDQQVWGGGFFSTVSRLQEAASETEAIARVGDLRFALDSVLAGEHAARIDATRIVAGGHSYGANTTLLASGAQIEREGRLLALRDARVRAAIVISAPPFYGEAEPRKILRAVTVPSLHITCTEDIIKIPGYYSGFDDRVAVFDATGSAHKWLAVYQGGSHSMFSDRGGALIPDVKDATQALAVDFLSAVFGGDGHALADWPQQHAAILARFSKVGV